MHLTDSKKHLADIDRASRLNKLKADPLPSMEGMVEELLTTLAACLGIALAANLLANALS